MLSSNALDNIQASTANIFGFWRLMYLCLIWVKPPHNCVRSPINLNKLAISILGKLSQYHSECKAEATADLYCSDQYNVPIGLFSKSKERDSLGLGHLIVFVKLGCFDQGVFVPMSAGAVDKTYYQNINKD